MSDFYSIVVSRTGLGVSRASFSNAIILGASNRFPGRYKAYDLTSATPTAEMTTDGFLDSDPEMLAVKRMVASSAKPSKVIIANCANRPTHKWRIAIYVAAASTTYSVKVGTTNVSITTAAGAAPTKAAVVALLKTAFDTAAPAGCTAAVVTDGGNTFLDVTASAAGAYIPVVCLTRKTVTVFQSHADPGVAADLDALAMAVQESNGAASFYVVILCFPSAAMVKAAAAWAETNKRLLVFTTNDTRAVRAVDVADKDVISELLAFSYGWTACIWHHDPAQFADSGWAGRCLPLQAGTETWHAKTIGGLEVSDLDGDERTQLQARRASYYISDNNRPLTAGQPGAQCISGEFIDNRRGMDELGARIGEDYIAATADKDEKTPYDDGGFQTLGGLVESSLKQYESQKGKPRLLAQDSIVVTVPLKKDVSAADREARTVPIEATAELANAAHMAKIKVVLT